MQIDQTLCDGENPLKSHKSKILEEEHMNGKRASIGKIIVADYWAFLSVAIAVVGAGFYLYNTFMNTNPVQGLDWLMIAAVVLGIAGMVWRIMAVSAIINNGQEIKATVSEISFYRGRGFIKYTYVHEGKTLMGKTAVMKTGATSRFQVGQEVTIAVNQGKSLIKDLFV
jgi:hypothetical protein